MSKGKSSALFSKKTPFDEESQRKPCSSKTVILGWIFAIILFFLLAILIVQFFFWPFGNRINIWAEKTVEGANTQLEDLPNEQNVGEYANPWDLDFLIDPLDVCETRNPPDSEQYEKNPEVKLLVLVPSAIGHFERRQAIRNTWGSVGDKKRCGPMRLAFVVGTTPNSTIDTIVCGESLVHGDIIQADFPDDQRQLTTKSILMLKWVTRRCPHAQYFLKADDDTFVNLGNIARILSGEPYPSEDLFISGNIQRDVESHRTAKQENHVPETGYSAGEYPPFVSGSSYMMTSQTAVELFGASQRVKPLLPNADVFLTGLCAEAIEAPLIHEPSFLTENPPIPPSWKTFSPLATAHSVTADMMDQVWKDMTESVQDSLRLMEEAINSSGFLRKKRIL